jgi:hypothetical protein
MNKHEEEPITGVFEVADALEASLATSDTAKLEVLSKTLNAYSEDFPDEYFWATGAQAPMILYSLMTVIELAGSPARARKSRNVIRLVDGKPIEDG